jgi:uncharacterized protein YndB with AHSA1/START domain
MWFVLRREEMGFIDRAPHVHVAEAVLAAPRGRVFSAFADPVGWPAWFPNVQAAAYLTPPPYGVGTIREARVSGTRWVEEMIAWDEGTRWAWTVLRASVPFAKAQVECFEFADASGSGTRVRWTLALDPRLVARLGSRVAPAALRRILRRAAATLDARLQQSRPSAEAAIAR